MLNIILFDKLNREAVLVISYAVFRMSYLNIAIIR